MSDSTTQRRHGCRALLILALWAGSSVPGVGEDAPRARPRPPAVLHRVEAASDDAAPPQARRTAKSSRGADPPHASDAPAPLQIAAAAAQEWADERDGSRVLLLRRCRITQGAWSAQAQRGAVWIGDDRQAGGVRAFVYLEDQVVLETDGQRESLAVHSAWLRAPASLDEEIPRRLVGEPALEDPLFQRAERRRNGDLRARPPVRTAGISPWEFDHDVAAPPPPELAARGIRRVRIFNRSATPYNLFSQQTETVPREQVWILTGGVNVVVDGGDAVGAVDMMADRVVIWTDPAEKLGEESLHDGDVPLQIYLEGNIVVRQGDSVLTARRAFYDAREDRAILLDAEVKLASPDMPVALRMRADRVRQLSRTRFHAQNAWLSTSRSGEPGYKLQSSSVTLEERESGFWFSEPGLEIDPATGLPAPSTTPWVSSENATLVVDGMPLFYWPHLSAPIEDPGVPLRKVTAGYDRVFGTEVYTVWNLYRLAGREQPRGARADLLVDYLGDRGPAAGLSAEFQSAADLFGMAGASKTGVQGYYIHDDGRDNLGFGRRRLAVDDPNRGRLRVEHFQTLGEGTTLIGEIGYISDRNFLEQYREPEWDSGKDNENLLFLKHQQGSLAFTALGKAQTNDFDTTTSWLPRGDVYLLGGSLFEGRINYSGHASAGYALLRAAEEPTDPSDVFQPLPYVADSEGLVLMARHEVSAPLALGPLNVVPYATGEASSWGEDLTGDANGRLYGRVGVRGSTMLWSVWPDLHSDVFGLNGLAHKMTLDFDYSYAQSSLDLDLILQFNEFDDVAQYRFRNRLAINTFGGILPDTFDPRRYAVRTGAGSWVSSPYHELVDDQHVLRLGWRHRLQTKTGPPDAPRIKDWMTLDLEGSFFPESDRDNFGEPFGLLSARYAWHVGDRTSILANAFYDTFEDGQRLWNVGLLNQRTERGSVYVGFRQVDGAGLSSQILTASYTYVLSPKWVSTFGTAYDVGEGQNRGQSLTLTRVGQDFLLHLGASYDASKDNVGIAISVEPRFLMFRSGGSPLAGLLGGG